MQQTLQNDDNLQGGFTYTFTFTLDNYLTMPSIATILADMDQLPDGIVGSVSASFSSGVGLLTNYLNLTFTYAGDGSDVVVDLANLLIAAFNNGSGDHFTFLQATGGTAGITALNSVTQVASDVGTAVGGAAGSIVGGVTSGVTSNLGLSGWAFLGMIVLGLVVYIMATTGIGRRAVA